MSASTMIAVLFASVALSAQALPVRTPAVQAPIAQAPGAQAVPAQNSDAVVKAIAHAVQQRLGKDVTVSVWQLTGLRFTGETTGLTAAPEPAARVGTAARFVLTATPKGHGTIRVGEAVATVQAVGPAVRAGRDLERGTVLAGADLRVESTDFSGRLLRPLPTLPDALGARVTHNLEAFAVVTYGDIAGRAAVRAGDLVKARARVEDVEVTGEMIAAGSGGRGDVIRVVNHETRHATRARVLGEGEVEILDVR